MPRKRLPPKRIQTRTIDALEKYMPQDIFMGQVIAVEGKFFVISIIGARWDNLLGFLIPDPKRAVIADLENPDIHLNLKLHIVE